MAIIQEFDLNMIPDSSPVSVYVDQYDKGSGRFKINLYNDSKKYTPSGATVKIQGTKPDKKGFSYSASISGNVVTANLTEQMTAVAGRVRVNVVVTEGNNRTGTFVFWLEVQATGLADDVDISETVLPEYIDGAKKAAEEAKEVAEEAKKAAEEAKKAAASIDIKDMTNSVKGIGRPDGVTAEADSGVFSALGVAIPATVNAGAEEYGADWLAGITPDKRQNYRVTVDGETSLYYWTGEKYAQLAGKGGSSDSEIKVFGVVDGDTLVFTDDSISSTAFISCPYIQGGLPGIKSAVLNSHTLTFTLSDSTADKKKAYILVIEGAVVSSIAVTTPPAKTVYDKNDTLDLTGIAVTATYSDGFTEDVTDKCTFNPANGSTLGTEGNTAISISYTEGGKTVSTSFSVTVSGGVKIVSWADGTDEEITAMVAAADAGKIDLTDYWNVGDERTVHLSAMAATGVSESHAEQDVTYVLVDADNENYTYVETPESGRTHPFFIVQQKNGLAGDDPKGSAGNLKEEGYMNDSNTNVGGWDACARRTWCNNVYRQALPSKLRNIFHKVKVKTMNNGEEKSGATLITSDDYFFLPAAREVFDGDGNQTKSGKKNTGNSIYTEWNALTQWQYYKTAINRVKRYGDSGDVRYWWERSPYYYNETYFCDVYSDSATESDGEANSAPASVKDLIAPAGAI